MAYNNTKISWLILQNAFKTMNDSKPTDSTNELLSGVILKGAVSVCADTDTHALTLYEEC